MKNELNCRRHAKRRAAEDDITKQKRIDDVADHICQGLNENEWLEDAGHDE